MQAILACDPRGGIGKNNDLPWDRLEHDLTRFQQLTRGKSIVMGRNTWDSLPKQPLPNRLNYVFTTRGNDLKDFPNTQQILNIKFIPNDAWVIGGSQIFKLLYDKLDEIHLSLTYQIYDCDTFIDLDQIYKDFDVVTREELTDHAYEILIRK